MEPPGKLQVLWFERRVNLETSTRGLEESEREVRHKQDQGNWSDFLRQTHI